ncbi:MAG: TetR/AcrR family transcriptional regulator [Treponema sp.]
MAAVVEHEKRKQEILQNALDVFIESGYENVTFQKIADRCGITRTTLYIYFSNKREIFLWSIKQFTSAIEQELLAIVNKKDMSAEKSLRDICVKILDECGRNQKLFNVLLVYLMQLKRAGEDPGERVLRRVIRLRHLLNLILIRGMKNGEFKRVNLRDANEMLYGLVESAIFKITILNQSDIGEVYNMVSLAIDGLKL